MAGEYPYWVWSPIYYNDSVLGIPEQVKGMAGAMSTLVNGWDPVTLAPALLQVDHATGGLVVSGSFSATTTAKSTAAAPTYVEGTTNPLSTDLSGALRISGTISASSSMRATTAAPTYVNGTDNPFSSDLAGNLRVTFGGTVSVSGPLTDAQLRATAVPVSGTFWQATQPVSGTFWQATQPVSGTFWQATQPVSGPLTDTQLRATAVPVSGTFWQATQPISGTVTANAGTGTFAVSGTFWQATQPVSGPLTDAQLRATAVPVSGTVTANIGTTNGLALDATLTGGTQQSRITDGTNVATVKAASTAAVAADKAVVVAISPNNPLTTSPADLTATGSITTQNLVPAGAATAGSAVSLTGLAGMATASIQVTGTYTGALSAQATVDGTNWVTLGGTPFLNINTGVLSGTIASAAVGVFQLDVSAFKQFRITGLAAMTGTAVVSIQTSNGARVISLDTPLPTGANVIGALTANQSVNNAQFNGVTPLMGNGITGTGSLRVTIASDNTAYTVNAAQSGTWNIGTVTTLTGITNALPAGANLIGRTVADASAATGGIATTTRMASAAASTNATNAKASAGRLYAAQGKNNAAYDIFLVLYDLAVSPTVGTSTIRKKIVCPAGQAFAYDWPLGLSFGTGISFAFTKLVADADTTVLVAADITAFNLDYV